MTDRQDAMFMMFIGIMICIVGSILDMTMDTHGHYNVIAFLTRSIGGLVVGWNLSRFIFSPKK